MNAQRLLAAFSKIGDDPDRIQQLRKIAVALAISGKLDNGATSMTPSEVLHAVNHVKSALAKRGAIPKPKRMEEVTAEQLPADFSDPTRFAPLGELARIEKGLTGIQQAQPGEYPLVVTSAERSTCDHFDFEEAAAIIPLVSSTGHGNASINRLHYQEGKFALGTILVAVFPYDPALMSARFLFEYLSAFKEELLVSRMTGTANVTLSVGRVAEVPVPLICPEVQRKVDELMALCDRLEAARAGREAVRDRLTAATLTRLTAPETDAETFPTHARFALHTLPTLTTREGQIKTLRQTILNLAVRGKLVTQDPADEPAAVLIGRLRSSRAELEQQKLILKPAKPKGVEDAPFVLPTSWLWSRLVEVCDVVDPNPSHRMPEYVAQNGYPLVSSQNFAENDQIDYSIGKKVSLSTVEEQAERFSILPGSFIFSRIGTIGKTRPLKAERSYAISHACCVINPVSADDLSMRFLRLALSAETILLQAHHGVQSVGVPDLGMGVMRAMQIPLPPLAEQHRIVAKVDALMALCDQLEASLTTATTTRSRLLEALLHEALDGQSEAAE